MRLNVELRRVRECLATQCAYNDQRVCHARAITVGDGAHPACDTFLPSPKHALDTSQIAGVGACKVTSCLHNRDFECTAKAIRVGTHETHADCLTFEPKRG